MIIGIDFKPNTGGIAELTHNLAVSVQSTGIHVVVLSTKKDDSAVFDSSQPYDVIRDDLDPPYKRYRRNRYLAWLVRKHIISIQPDAIMCNTYDRISSIVQRVSRSERIPFFVYVHGLDVALKRKLRHRKTKERVLRRADGVIANSKNTRDLAITGGSRQDRTHVVTPGVFNTATESHSKNRTELPEKVRGASHVLLSVGRLIQRKGFDTVIHALPSIQEKYPGVVYVLIGDGPDRARLETLGISNACGDSVIFLGTVDESMKNECYRTADVFVMPNRNMANGDMEGFGIVFLEANLFGKPVIGGNAGGVPDSIEHGRSGFLVHPDNVEDFSRRVVELFSQPEVAKKMGVYGRQRAIEQFDWSTRGRIVAEILAGGQH